MESIEDRVNIALSDMRHQPSGDTPYWDLLKNVKYARKFYVIADPDNVRHGPTHTSLAKHTRTRLL